MPREYTAMRDAFIRRGMADAAAKTKAARIYNSKHPKSPVTRGDGKYRDNRDKRDNTGGRDE